MLAEARRQRAPFADQLAGLRDELVALESLLQPVTPKQTCHLDLWADNVRGTPLDRDVLGEIHAVTRSLNKSR